ncbi:glutathione S-transferase II [Penicillium cosmopolitanum]|uniref:Glutathione S-transferase II n=1 Tax=Penicillium cosmopolitanum TaxID=1131564 RepID=A0A9W9VQI9_9EURO|nr:glutathione S-transferase II [Penicillium cosmopolitanum]KAJ5387482.1 glutathione S-transferase II [Penicillium cosmopolitanum]
MGTSTDITLYTASTPNGIKVPILLEELGLEFKLQPIRIMDNEQKEPWFLEINPNGRIPAITDTWTDGERIRVFESGAILEYIVDRYDKDYKASYPKDSREYWEVKSWLMWQMGGLGPMKGQLEHFQKYAPEKIEYSINRYSNETRRLYGTMENHLAKSSHGFLVGDRVTIADIACFGWISSHADGIFLSDFPHLERWMDKLSKRPGFDKGRHVMNRANV